MLCRQYLKSDNPSQTLAPATLPAVTISPRRSIVRDALLCATIFSHFRLTNDPLDRL